jgi:hypothetical protein
VLRIWDVDSGSCFFHPRSNNNKKGREKNKFVDFEQVQKKIRVNFQRNQVFLTQEIVSKLSENMGWIRDPEKA